MIEQPKTPERAEQRRKLREAERLLRDVLVKALLCDACGRPLSDVGCQHWERDHTKVHLIKGLRDE